INGSIGADQNVGRLDIAMDDALAVGVVEPSRNLTNEGQGHRLLEWVGYHQLLEGLAFHKLHGDVWKALILTRVIYGHNPGMIQAAYRPDFAKNSLPVVFLLRGADILGQPHNLDRHMPVDHWVE